MVEIGNVSHLKHAGGCEQKHASQIVSEIADSLVHIGQINEEINTYVHT